MNKKAGYAQPVIDFYAAVLIVIILVIFFGILRFHSGNFDWTIQQQVGNIDGSIILGQFLKSTVTVNDEQTTIAEYLDTVKLPLTAARRRPLENFVWTYFADFEKKSGCPINIRFYIDNDNFQVAPKSDLERNCMYSYQSTMFIPSQKGTRLSVTLGGGK